MSLNAALRSAARLAIRATGSPVTLTRTAEVGYDPSTRQFVEDARVASYALTGRIEEYLDRQFGGNVKVGDRKLYIAASDCPVVPAITDRVTIEGVSHTIVRVTQDRGMDPAIYTLQVRH